MNGGSKYCNNIVTLTAYSPKTKSPGLPLSGTCHCAVFCSGSVNGSLKHLRHTTPMLLFRSVRPHQRTPDIWIWHDPRSRYSIAPWPLPLQGVQTERGAERNRSASLASPTNSQVRRHAFPGSNPFPPSLSIMRAVHRCDEGVYRYGAAGSRDAQGSRSQFNSSPTCGSSSHHWPWMLSSSHRQKESSVLRCNAVKPEDVDDTTSLYQVGVQPLPAVLRGPVPGLSPINLSYACVKGSPHS